MTERSYVFKLIGDASQLQAATDAGGRAVDDLAAKTAAASQRSAAADRSAAQARGALNSATGQLNATTSLGATNFLRFQDSLKGLEAAGTSLGATASAAQSIAPAVGLATTALSSHGKEADAAGKLVHGFSFETAAAKRELLVLGHELSQGNYKRFGGSLLVLGEQTGAAALLFSAFGIAAIAVTAAVGGYFYALYKGHEQQQEFNDALLLSGNYAGLTEGKFDALTRSIAASTNASVGASRGALQAVIGAGVFGPSQLQPVTEATVRLEEITGKSADKIVEDFAKMGDGVAKYAAEHNKSLHVISAAQYEQIKALEEAGRGEEAQGVYLAALNGRLAEHDKSIGTIGRAWRDAKNAASGYIQSLQDIGKTPTIDTALSQAQIDLKRLRGAQDQTGYAGLRETISAGLSGDFTPQIKAQEALVERLKQSKALNEQVAASQADSDKRHAAAIAGSQVVDQIKKEVDKRSEAIKKVEEYTVAVRKMREGNDPKAPTAREESATIAAINEKYKTRGDRAAEKLDTRFQDRLVALQAEGIKLDAETRNYELYGRSIDRSRVALLDLEIAQGKLKGLDPARIAQLRALASADDKKDQALDQAKVNAEVDKSIAQLRDQATLKQANARDTEVAARLAEMEAKGVKVGTETYIENAASIRLWVGVKHDQILARQLAQQQLATDAEVNKLDEETRLLGLSTLERQKATVALREQQTVAAQIANNPGQTAQIIDASITRQNALTAAIERSYAASREFGTGASSALQKYAEDATNYGALADRAIGGGMQRAEDAIVEFEKTGKLHLGSLFQFMADEFIRQQARMLLASATSSAGGAGGWISAIGSAAASFFGGSGELTTGQYSSSGFATGTNPNYGNEGRNFGGPRAAGGDVAAGRLYRVNEEGPELLNQGGRDYLMMGGQGGTITPLGRNAGGSGAGRAPAPVTNVHIETPPGYTGKVEKRNNDQGGVDIVAKVIEIVADDMTSGGRIHDATQRRFGLNSGGSTPRF